jgi:L-asparaginase / beta-aspartyl-peptidase
MTVKYALIAHGGAGGRAPTGDRAARKSGLIAAVKRGEQILRRGERALDAVIAVVTALENDVLFNAGYGSTLTIDGRVEMDAAVAVAEPVYANRASAGLEGQSRSRGGRSGRSVRICVGGVVLVNRVRNPILLARAVMERTPHILMSGAGAERLAREAGLRLCRPDQLVSRRARERWILLTQQHPPFPATGRGTVGAVALDAAGSLAAATSTGGVPGKLAGRIGDSAIIGAGLFADGTGAASATGTGEEIMKVGLCREAVAGASRRHPNEAAARAVSRLAAIDGAEAGIVMVDSSGRLGFAHNADAMEIAMCDSGGGVQYALPDSLKSR